MSNYCNQIIRQGGERQTLCKLPIGHTGRHNASPFLDTLRLTHEAIADKIERDAYNSRGRGASNNLYKNRSFRWDVTITESQAQTLINEGKTNYGIPLKEYATQEDCFLVAQKLTRLVYEMINAPICLPEVIALLDTPPNPQQNPCICPLCKKPIDINEFALNEHGEGFIQIWHIEPLTEQEHRHKADNVAWGHGMCNTAQGERSTQETINWMFEIVKAHNLVQTL
ncbi:MAG: hypothetical protein EAZ95_16860 [Bacteroidetes bacterium]|nr:MAG: hypothetical protein EAZ95_16860 [Bacteroidota bacterium]